MSVDLKRLVVVPSEPLEGYVQKGIGARLQGYYNPGGTFDEVYAISRLEKGVTSAHGMTVIGVRDGNEFRQHIADIQPQVVRAYGGYGAADFACRYRYKKVPVVVSLHDTNPDNIYPAVRHADQVWCMSKVLMRQAEEFGVEKARLKLLPNRVDTDSFSGASRKPPESVEAFGPGKYLLHVGRAEHQKNLDTLIRSLTYLPAEYKIVALGPGRVGKYERLAKEIGVGKRFNHLGPKANEELAAWYGWCTAMVTPSRWEGFGVVFIEAAACGAPIITSDIAPMNEYLTHGQSAELVSAFEDPKQLSEAILRVCEGETYRQLLRENALSVASDFDKNKVDKLEVEYYRDALNLPPRGKLKQLGDLTWRLQTSTRIRRFKKSLSISSMKKSRLGQYS